MVSNRSPFIGELESFDSLDLLDLSLYELFSFIWCHSDSTKLIRSLRFYRKREVQNMEGTMIKSNTGMRRAGTGQLATELVHQVGCVTQGP